MATAEQIADLFVFDDGQYKVIGREDEFAIQKFGPVAFDTVDPKAYSKPQAVVLYSYSGEGAAASSSIRGQFGSLEDAQRACLKLAGIDPDVDAELEDQPGPKMA